MPTQPLTACQSSSRTLCAVGRLGVLVLGALALRAVATRLRIDGEGVELNEGLKPRLRWDEVAEARVFRVRSRRYVETGSPGLNVSYCLATKPVAIEGGRVELVRSSPKTSIATILSPASVPAVAGAWVPSRSTSYRARFGGWQDSRI
ncbi:hypothetical protein ACGF0D_42060 [Kitasatospora sp. NPDC048298]|uniref:hypothetical protein n=1 Tax=Kitasatospora sp. NPDC048298 TaxID=3364049 RepID=UPI00371C8A61